MKGQSSRQLVNDKIEDFTKFIAYLGLDGTFQEEYFYPQKI